jgi:hypothetical protein
MNGVQTIMFRNESLSAAIFGEKSFSKSRCQSYKAAGRVPIPHLLTGSHYFTTGNATDFQRTQQRFGKQDISHF